MTEVQTLLTEASAQPSVVDVTLHATLSGVDAQVLRSAYLAAFEPLKPFTATRHVTRDDEWAHMLADPALTKFVARLDGEALGMCIATDHLDAVDWLSVDFFERQYPEQMAAGTVWYIVTVFVDPEAQAGPLFKALIDVVTGAVPAEGVLVWDLCKLNDEVLDLGGRVVRALKRKGRSVEDHDVAIDTQTFYGLGLGALPADAEITLR